MPQPANASPIHPVSQQSELEASLAQLADAVLPDSCPAYDPNSVERGTVDRGSLLAWLLHGLLEDRVGFKFNYQPIVDLQQGVTVGYEALVRFDGAPLLSPDQWFSQAEQLGLRMQLEKRVIARLLESRPPLPPNCFLSLNVSPSFILSDEWDVLVRSMPTLAGTVVEITENEAVPQYAPLLEKVARIRKRGGMIAVDDAGSGYSSLHHVITLKPDFVKLDRAFITNCDTDRAKSALIEMVGKAAGRLDAWIIAEGVETAGELAELHRLQVPLAQGYYLARPSPLMHPLPPEQSLLLAKQGGPLTPVVTVAQATEYSPVCMDVSSARQRLAETPHVHAAVVLDANGRPDEFVDRHAQLGLRVVPHPMKVQVATPALVALQRAMTRSEPSRFDPLIVINEVGKLVGIVRIDRLILSSFPEQD